ncbi:MAG: hypothetical protein AAGC67_07840 [Myxococcota bacterium]
MSRLIRPRPAPFAALLLAAAASLTACAGHTPLAGCDPADGVTPICGFQNPEDLVTLDDEWLLVSQMTLGDAAGNLLAFRPADGSRRILWPTSGTMTEARRADGDGCAPPATDLFAPHGIDLSRDRRSLLVVNHGGREAVERFRIDERDGVPVLVWTDCVAFDDAILLNDVASLPGGGFVVTEMMGKGVSAQLALVTGRDTGQVWHWTPEAGARAIPGSGGQGPNGIAASADGRTVFIADWGGEQLVRIGLDGADRAVAPLGFHPDNLSWTADGQVLAGGQLVGPIEATRCFDLLEGGCSLASAAARVDPATLAVRRVWTHDPATAAGGISSALERGDSIWLGAYGGDRIARIPAR